MQRLNDANAKTNIHCNDYADTNANDDTNMKTNTKTCLNIHFHVSIDTYLLIHT